MASKLTIGNRGMDTWVLQNKAQQKVSGFTEITSSVHKIRVGVEQLTE
jgi:hypothetical protein